MLLLVFVAAAHALYASCKPSPDLMSPFDLFDEASCRCVGTYGQKSENARSIER